MVKIITNLIPLSTSHQVGDRKVFIRKGSKIKPTTLTIHSTANLHSTAMNERNWLINLSNKSEASWNIAVDDEEAVIAIPLEEKSNHTGRNEGNMTSIGLEICESGDREKTLRNAIDVSIWILKKFNLTYKDLRQHYDWNKKNCPRILRETGRWEWFVNEVKKGMEEENMLQELINLYGEGNVKSALKNLIEKEANKNIIPTWAIGEYSMAIKDKITDGERPQDLATRCEVAIMVERALKK